MYTVFSPEIVASGSKTDDYITNSTDLCIWCIFAVLVFILLIKYTLRVFFFDEAVSNVNIVSSIERSHDNEV